MPGGCGGEPVCAGGALRLATGTAVNFTEDQFRRCAAVFTSKAVLRSGLAEAGAIALRAEGSEAAREPGAEMTDHPHARRFGVGAHIGLNAGGALRRGIDGSQHGNAQSFAVVHAFVDSVGVARRARDEVVRWKMHAGGEIERLVEIRASLLGIVRFGGYDLL